MRLNVHHFGPADGEPLLAIHGVTGHGRRFESFAKTALPDRHVLSVDLRGHGKSGWDPPWDVDTHVADLLETLTAEEITEPIDVMGHSFGGLLALSLTVAAPERVRRAILLDPAIAMPVDYCDERARDAIDFAGWETPEQALAEREVQVAPHAHHFIPAEIAEHVKLGADGRFRGRFSPDAAATAWRAIARPMPAPTEQQPILIVRALNDIYVRDDTLIEPLRAAIGEHLEVVGLNSAHMIYWEAPTEAAEAIKRFLT